MVAVHINCGHLSPAYKRPYCPNIYTVAKELNKLTRELVMLLSWHSSKEMIYRVGGVKDAYFFLNKITEGLSLYPFCNLLFSTILNKQKSVSNSATVDFETLLLMSIEKCEEQKRGKTKQTKTHYL